MDTLKLRRLTVSLGLAGVVVLLVTACADGAGPVVSSTSDSQASSDTPARSDAPSNSIVLRGPGDQDSDRITTDESDYLLQWQATNLQSDPEMPALPCMFEIVFFREGGAGARTGGGGYGALTLHTHYSSASTDTGRGTFKPHSGHGYLSVKACDQARWVVVMQRLS